MCSARSCLYYLFIEDKSNSIPFSVTLTGFSFKLLFLISAIRSALLEVILFAFMFSGTGGSFSGGGKLIKGGGGNLRTGVGPKFIEGGSGGKPDKSIYGGGGRFSIVLGLEAQVVSSSYSSYSLIKSKCFLSKSGFY